MCSKSTESFPQATVAMTKSYKGNNVKHERLNCTIIDYNSIYMFFPFINRIKGALQEGLISSSLQRSIINQKSESKVTV